MRRPANQSLSRAVVACMAMRPALRRSMRRRFAGWCMAILAAAAIAPSVVPYDHLLPLHVEAAHAGAQADDHEQHCHGSPADCADAPVTSGPGQILGADALIIAPAFAGVLVVAAVIVMRGITTRPDLPPPLAT